jgi:hypothetical protein
VQGTSSSTAIEIIKRLTLAVVKVKVFPHLEASVSLSYRTWNSTCKRLYKVVSAEVFQRISAIKKTGHNSEQSSLSHRQTLTF